MHLMGLSMWTHPYAWCQHPTRHVVVVGMHPSPTSHGCDEVVAGPSEILLDQSDLTSELTGIPLGKPGALSLESGSSLGFSMLVGQGRELVRED